MRGDNDNMELRFTAHRDGFVDYDGTEVEPYDKEFASPFLPGGICAGHNSYCYVLYQNWRGKWQIKEEIVDSICYNGIWSYKLSNGWYVCADCFGETLFTYDQFRLAKEECLHRNKLRKVKVKYLRQ